MILNYTAVVLTSASVIQKLYFQFFIIFFLNFFIKFVFKQQVYLIIQITN